VRTATARLRGQLLGKAGFADPWVADEQEEAAPTGEGLLEASVKLRQLSLPPNEGPLRALGGVRRFPV